MTIRTDTRTSEDEDTKRKKLTNPLSPRCSQSYDSFLSPLSIPAFLYPHFSLKLNGASEKDFIPKNFHKIKNECIIADVTSVMYPSMVTKNG